MQIAFWGIARQIGTSANMAAVAAGLERYAQIPDTFILKECGSGQWEEETIKSCQLLVVNITIPHQGMENIYLKHLPVHKNIIFLVGKYHQNQFDELKSLVRQYRIDTSGVCTIPYNMRFQKAYENRTVFTYVRNFEKTAKSCEDSLFERSLKHTVNKILHFETAL